MESMWLEIIKNAGVIGVLVSLLVLMVRGDLLPKAVVNRMMEEADHRAELMADRIVKAMQEGIAKSVEAGILQAVTEIREMSPVTRKLRERIEAKAK